MDDAVQLQLRTLDSVSKRRRLSVLRVARTIADLDESMKIRLKDFDEAVQVTLETHRALEEWRD